MSQESANQRFIKQQIQIKNSCAYPYQSFANDVKHVLTDMDHFPYTRFYRGQYNDAQPHIYGREAGYHPLQNSEYIHHNTYAVQKHESPTQVPCTTVLPTKLCHRTSLSNTNDCVNSSP